jgi:hypothetical protein
MRFTGVRQMLLFAVMLTGCASGGFRSSFQTCRERSEPRADYAVEHHFSGGRLQVSHRVEDCYHVVRTALDGQQFESRGYHLVDDLVIDASGTRLAFVGMDVVSYAVIDGVESQPHKEIVWRPTFSRNGRHVAYLAREEGGGTLVVDGEIVDRAHDYSANNLVIGDDGRAGAVRKTRDGDFQATFGGEESQLFDAICDLSFEVSESGRFAFVGRRKNDFIAVVDMEEIAAPGVPLGCKVAFTPNGERFAYVTHDRHRDFSSGKAEEISSYTVVVDGEVLPVDGRASIASLRNELIVVSLSNKSSSTTLWVIGAATPRNATVEDEYTPARSAGARGVRVRLGDSLGPAFDSVDLKSFELGRDGEVSYVGVRGSTRQTVIGNVISLPTPPPAAKSPVVPVIADDPPPPSQTVAQ